MLVKEHIICKHRAIAVESLFPPVILKWDMWWEDPMEAQGHHYDDKTIPPPSSMAELSDVSQKGH